MSCQARPLFTSPAHQDFYYYKISLSSLFFSTPRTCTSIGFQICDLYSSIHNNSTMTSPFFLTVLFCYSLSLFGQVAAEAVGHAQKPAVILVPAAFSKAAVYDQVGRILSHHGYDVIAVDLPSVGRDAVKVDRRPDIKVVQKALKEKLNQGKDVILVGNSYGGTVICDAVEDFEAKSSIKFNDKGKILGLIFVSPVFSTSTDK